MKMPRLIVPLLLILILFPAKAVSGEGRSEALFEAVASSPNADDRKIDALIRNGADVNARDSRGCTILNKVLTEGRWDIARRLIEGGADVNAENQSGDTPLHIAVSKGHEETVALLISKGAEVNNRDVPGASPLYEAVRLADKAIVRLLVAKGADTNAVGSEGRSCLEEALRGRQSEIAEILVDGGSEISRPMADDMTPFMWALSHGDIRLAKAMVKKGADINAVDAFFHATPLAVAVRNKNKAMVEFLLSRKADISNEKGHLPLVQAISDNSEKIAASLISKGVDLHFRNRAGRTALMIASMQGRSEIVELLIRRGSDVTATDPDGLSAWQLALQHGYKDINGRTALMIADQNGYEQIVMLIDKAPSNQGQSI